MSSLNQLGNPIPYPQRSAGKITAVLLIIAAQTVLAAGKTAPAVLQENSHNRQQPAIEISLPENNPGAIRMRASQAALSRILDALADKTGTKIHYAGLPSKPVSAICAGADVKTVIECLLGPVDLAVKLPDKHSKPAANNKNASQIAELWLLSTETNNRLITATTGTTAAVEQPAKPHRLTAAEKDRDRLDETLQETASKNPEQRATAIYNLGLTGPKDDPDVKAALKQALTDEDPNVREQAAASIRQSGDPDLIAELNRQTNASNDAGPVTDENSLSQDLVLLHKAMQGGEKTALEFLMTRQPGNQIEH